MDEWEDFDPEKVEEEPLADDAVPLCPNCLEPCSPLDNYCPHCGSNEAINPLASYMPFVDLRLRIGMLGKLWQKMLASETILISRLIYFGFFLLFCPFILFIGVPVIIIEKIISRKKKSVLE